MPFVVARNDRVGIGVGNEAWLEFAHRHRNGWKRGYRCFCSNADGRRRCNRNSGSTADSSYIIEAMVEECLAKEFTGQIVPLYYDVTEPTGPAELARQAQEKAGPIDILVNVAGAAKRLKLSDSAPPETWAESMMFNFFRARELAHALLPEMMKRHWGPIVNINSGLEPAGINPAQPAKVAMHIWAKSLSREVAKDGVTWRDD